MNPIQLIKSFIGNRMSPKQIASQMIGKQNPMMGNLIEMANNGKEKEIETFARNFCKERGIDFDKEYSDFISNFR